LSECTFVPILKMNETEAICTTIKRQGLGLFNIQSYVPNKLFLHLLLKRQLVKPQTTNFLLWTQLPMLCLWAEIASSARVYTSKAPIQQEVWQQASFLTSASSQALHRPPSMTLTTWFMVADFNMHL
jgi:hypothetical protein